MAVSATVSPSVFFSVIHLLPEKAGVLFMTSFEDFGLVTL